MIPSPCACGCCPVCDRYRNDIRYKERWDSGRNLKQKRWPKDGPVRRLIVIDSAGIGDCIQVCWMAHGMKARWPDDSIELVCQPKNHPWVRPFWDGVLHDVNRPLPKCHFKFDPYASYNTELKNRGGKGRLQYYSERCWNTKPVQPPNTLDPIPCGTVLCANCAWPNRKYMRWQEIEALVDDPVIISDRKHVTLKSPQLVGMEPERVLRYLAGAQLVVAQDSGLAHCAATIGTKTVVIAGPTGREIFQHYTGVTVIQAQMDCAPCWFQSDKFHRQCQTRYCEALMGLPGEEVVRQITGSIEDIGRLSLPTVL